MVKALTAPAAPLAQACFTFLLEPSCNLSSYCGEKRRKPDGMESGSPQTMGASSRNLSSPCPDLGGEVSLQREDKYRRGRCQIAARMVRLADLADMSSPGSYFRLQGSRTSNVVVRLVGSKEIDLFDALPSNNAAPTFASSPDLFAQSTPKPPAGRQQALTVLMSRSANWHARCSLIIPAIQSRVETMIASPLYEIIRWLSHPLGRSRFRETAPYPVLCN